MREVSAEEHIALVDLNAMSKSFYEALGRVEAHLAFAGKDTTHHDNYGSYEFAKCVAQGLKDAKSPLAKYLIDMPRFDPAHPDPPALFQIPGRAAVFERNAIWEVTGLAFRYRLIFLNHPFKKIGLTKRRASSRILRFLTLVLMMVESSWRR